MCLNLDIWKEVGAGLNAAGCCWVLGLPGKASRACACIAGCCLPHVCLAAFIALRVLLWCAVLSCLLSWQLAPSPPRQGVY